MPSFKTREETNKIVVHCADTYANMDIGVKEIDEWHRSRGWLAIGYHFVIRRDGTIESGRPPRAEGAHVKFHNSDSIGICLVGGKGVNKEPEDNFTFEQRCSLKTLLEVLTAFYPSAEIVGHSHLNTLKTCPNFDLYEELDRWEIRSDKT